MATGCFDESAAARLARGAMDLAEAETIRAHASSCEACAARLRAEQEAFAARAEAPTHRRETVPELAAPGLAKPKAGSLVGRYLLLAPLGDGGMGQVWSAYDPMLERKIAVKVLRPGPHQAPGEDGQARQLAEAKTMAKLSHPNVLPIHDVGLWEGQVFLAMELAGAGDVRRWLRQRERSPREILDVFVGAGRGLAAAHSKRLVHCDFKPANILIGDDGVARITDFGIARRLPEVSLPPHPAERREAPEGTPGYFAPEQLEGQTATVRSDQYGFAVSLWQALYGRRPFNGAGVEELLQAMRGGAVEPEPPGCKVPGRVRRVLLRALSADPSARYPSMDALLADLGADPWSKFRRWAPLAVGLLAAIAVAGGFARAELARRSACSASRSPLVGVWDAARKAAARDALVATGHPLAGSTWAALEPLVDRYAESWGAMAEQACDAARVRGTESPLLYQLRTACRGRRVAELDALVRRSERADAPLVEKALQVASALSPVSVCANQSALERAVQPPSDPATRAEVQRLEGQLDRLRLHRLAAQYRAAEELLAPLREAAAKVGYRPLQARVELQAGLMQEERNELAQAEATLFTAVSRAEAGNDRATLAQAASRLMYVTGFLQGRVAEGLAWGAFADSALEALGAVEPALEADVHSDRAAVYLIHLESGPALEEARKALELRRQAFGDDHYLVARSFNNLGLALGRVRREAEALEMVRQGVKVTEKVLGPDHPQTLLYTTNLAIELRPLGRLAEAEAVAAGVLARSRKLFGDEHRATTSALLILARIHFDLGKLDEGLREIREVIGGLERARRGPTTKALALCLLGDLLRAHGEHAEALAAFQQGIAILEADPKLYGAEAIEEYAGYGDVLLALGRWSEAIAAYQKGIDAPPPELHDRSFAGRLRFGLARALWEGGGDRERARALAAEAADLWEKTGFHAQDVAEVRAWIASRP